MSETPTGTHSLMSSPFLPLSQGDPGVAEKRQEIIHRILSAEFDFRDVLNEKL